MCTHKHMRMTYLYQSLFPFASVWCFSGRALSRVLVITSRHYFISKMTRCWTTGSARVARAPILIVLDRSSIDSTHSNQTNLLMTRSGSSSPRMEKIPYRFHQHQPRLLRILEISYQMHPIATRSGLSSGRGM